MDEVNCEKYYNEVGSYLHYLRGMMRAIEKTMVDEVARVTHNPKIHIESGQIMVRNENYTCGVEFMVIKDEEDNKSELLPSEVAGLKGYIPLFIIMIKDFLYAKDLTSVLNEYIEARNMREDIESIGTCVAICMKLEHELHSEFLDRYATYAICKNWRDL